MSYLKQKAELYNLLSPNEKMATSYKEFKPITMKKKHTDVDEITKKEDMNVSSKPRWRLMPIASLKRLIKEKYKQHGFNILVSKMSREQLIYSLGQLLYLVNKKEYYN